MIANLLVAPGQDLVTEAAIRLRLATAARPLRASCDWALLAAINQRGLTLPGDRRRLPLRFEPNPHEIVGATW